MTVQLLLDPKPWNEFYTLTKIILSNFEQWNGR